MGTKVKKFFNERNTHSENPIPDPDADLAARGLILQYRKMLVDVNALNSKGFTGRATLKIVDGEIVLDVFYFEQPDLGNSYTYEWKEE